MSEKEQDESNEWTTALDGDKKLTWYCKFCKVNRPITRDEANSEFHKSRMCPNCVIEPMTLLEQGGMHLIDKIRKENTMERGEFGKKMLKMRAEGHECIKNIDIKYQFSDNGWELVIWNSSVRHRTIYGAIYCLFCGVEML